jgi:PAS domain S-box-containing protein
LLIEDNPDDAFLVVEGLSEEGNGWGVAVAGDGVEALDFLRGRLDAPNAPLPGAILLDLDLPKKGGLEVLREIKEDGRLRRIPVVIMTSSDDKVHLKEACNLQVNGYITKPFTGEHLRKAIHSIDRFRFSVVLESLPDAVVVTDEAFAITLVNDQAERLFHSTRHEMLGRPIHTLVAEPRREEYLGHLGGYYPGVAVRRRSRVEFETRGRRGDGVEFPLRVSLGPLQAEEGVLVAGTMRDISEQKHAESALIDARDGLEATVRERTAELQKAFVEQQVLLKEIHHRVKNNLQLISSMIRRQARLTQRSGPASRGAPESARDQLLCGLNEIQNRIQSMSLVHEMLYRSGSLASIDFSAYLDELADHLRRSFDAAGLIALRADAERVSFDIDTAVRCGLIVTELVSNGYKHAFPEGRCGEIVVGLHAAPGGRFLLSVSDDGVGVPGSVDVANTKSLGLQLVHDLVADLDGVVELRRTPGATYRVLFTPIGARS